MKKLLIALLSLMLLTASAFAEGEPDENAFVPTASRPPATPGRWQNTPPSP